jgi:hypothetical protein
VTTTESSITKNMTPAEAATLLAKLQEGHQAAWRATRETRRESAERESRFQNAAEVDGVFRDLMWETLSNGTRHPGESVAQFAERVHVGARRAAARDAGTQKAADPMTQRTGPEVIPGPAAISHDEDPAQLLGGMGTPLGQAYAKAFSGTAAARVRELRKHDPLPEPDRTLGAPHADPFLASRGWHVNDHGIYTRRAEPETKARLGRELEAGS